MVLFGIIVDINNDCFIIKQLQNEWLKLLSRELLL